MDKNLEYAICYALSEALENTKILYSNGFVDEEDTELFDSLLSQVKESIKSKKNHNTSKGVYDAKLPIEDILNHTTNVRIRWVLDALKKETTQTGYYARRFGNFEIPKKVEDIANIRKSFYLCIDNVGKKTTTEFFDILKLYGIHL